MNGKQTRQPKQDLFTSAMGGGTIRRSRELALVTFRDSVLITTSDDLRKAQLWGRARDASPSEHDDRVSLLLQLDTVITKVDAKEPTRGGPEALARLARLMRESGMNLAEWRLPQSLRDALLPSTL
jgi:hypothetical protein